MWVRVCLPVCLSVLLAICLAGCVSVCLYVGLSLSRWLSLSGWSACLEKKEGAKDGSWGRHLLKMSSSTAEHYVMCSPFGFQRSSQIPTLHPRHAAHIRCARDWAPNGLPSTENCSFCSEVKDRRASETLNTARQAQQLCTIMAQQTMRLDATGLADVPQT